MPAKRNGPKGCRQIGSASPVRMVKPALVEPQFPTVKFAARRSILEATTPFIASFTQRLVKALCGEYLRTNRARKRMGAPTRTERLRCVNAGSPVWREPHGDGVPIVPKRVGSGPRPGEGEQVTTFLLFHSYREETLPIGENQ